MIVLYRVFEGLQTVSKQGKPDNRVFPFLSKRNSQFVILREKGDLLMC